DEAFWDSHSIFTQTFDDFQVLNGTIDSITYVMNTNLDTLTVTSYVTDLLGEVKIQHTSTAKLSCSAGTTLKAFLCADDVTLNGNAEIQGGLEEYATINFEEIFGKTMTEMKDSADHYYKNPNKLSYLSGITYVEMTGNKSLKFNGNWSGSGILIIDGDIQTSGNCNFQGVLWVEQGSFQMTGNTYLRGIVFANTTEDVKLTGNTYIIYDEAIVNDLIGTPTSSSAFNLEILSWDN
ncbi:MAG TPA: hypothetical protein PLD62_04605, partial [Candidatus Cloacimonadota bacterium]|nr:hypothetical protein [Candidatus Cloacimonadota bacterium]